MQSCCFFFVFFSRPFHENFKFLKNCPYDFHEILHSHSTPKGAPACAKASKSYGWDVRNIAKISPKMAKKQPFFDFFRFSQKLSIRFERVAVNRSNFYGRKDSGRTFWSNCRDRMECGRILSYLLYGSVASLPSPSSNIEAWPYGTSLLFASLLHSGH